MRWQLKGGQVVDPAQGLDDVADVFIEDGVVVGVGRGPRGFKAERVFDARGLVVCPGFADPGSHLREPGYEHKDRKSTRLNSSH